MTAKTWLTSLGAAWGGLSQLNWIAVNGFDEIWFLRLAAAPLLGAAMGRLPVMAWERFSRRPFWPGFFRLGRRLSGLCWQTGLLFLIILSVFLLSMGGRFYSGDDPFRFRTVKALADHGALAIGQKNGKPVYSKYGILQPSLAVPLYLVGKHFMGPAKGFEKFDEVITSTLMQLVSAAACAVFFLLLLGLGYTRPQAMAAAFITAFATMAWPYAKQFFTEPLTGFLLLAAFALLVKFRKDGGAPELAGAGLALGLAGVNTPQIFLLAVPLFGLYLLFVLRQGPGGAAPSWGLALRSLLLFGLPLALCLAGQLGFNAFRYGSPFTTGYEGDHGYPSIIYDGSPGWSVAWWVGLHGLLLSPGKSLFLYSPPLLAALFAFRGFWQSHKPEALLLLGLLAAWLAFYAKWWAWHGDVSWGPRYLMPLLFLLCLPLAQAARAAGGRGWGSRALFGLVLAAGVLVQVVAVSLPFDTYFRKVVVSADYAEQYLLHYVPHFSPVLGQYDLIAQGLPLDFYLYDSAVALPLALAIAVFGHLLWLGAARPGREETP